MLVLSKQELPERSLNVGFLSLQRIIILLFAIFLVVISKPERLLAKEQEYDTLFAETRLMLERSVPDTAIPVLIDIVTRYPQRNDIVNYAHINLAEAYRMKKEYKKATDLLYEALQSDSLTPHNKAHAYNRLAALYNEWENSGKHRRDSVEKYSRLCMKLSKKNNFTELLAASQNELAYIFRLRNDFDSALIYSSNAYNSFYYTGSYPQALNTAINMAGVYLAIKEHRKGLELLDTAAQFVNPADYQSLFMRMHLRKSDFYADLGNYKKAFKAMNKARKMQEGFFINRMNEKIQEMSAKYDLKTKEQKIQEVENRNKLQRQRNIYLTLLSAVLAAILLIIFYVHRLKRKVRKQKETIIKQENIKIQAELALKLEELKNKSRELSIAIGHIISFNETLEKIKQAVINKNEKAAMEIINSNRNLEHNWDKFKVSFEEIHPNFLIRLNHKFPKLTANDRKLCAFLLMGMKTLEIAKLMGISQSSVSKSRNRLRKKIELPQGADIAEFLKQFC
ncbi:MAG: tetratricopeptide repeat protein [Bacteroidales bacterium]